MTNKIQIGASNTLVNKQRELVHKAKYTLSVNSMKYLSSLICMIHQDDTEFKVYSTTANEMTELIGSKIDTIKLRQISSELLNLKVATIDSKGRYNGGFNTFDNVEYSNDTFAIEAQFGIKARPYLLEFKKDYLSYGIKNILPLKSTVVIRLYEICKDKLTANPKKPKRVYFDMPLSEFRELFGIKDSYKYAHIKERYLNKAVKQFQEYTDIEMAFKEVTKGRRVDSIQFIVKRKDSSDSNFNPKLKFKEIYIKSIEHFANFSEEFEDDFFEMDEGYNLIRGNGGELLLCDDNGIIFPKEEASEIWEYIFNNMETFVNKNWIDKNKNEWE